MGNLSAAGRKLGVPLTTISRKISDLENHLGARLLQRSNRSVTLTEAGQSYVVACQRILRDVAEAELAAAGQFTSARGELTLTAPVVFGRLHVLPVVTAFLQTYPEIDIKLTLADRLLHLQDDHVDVAIRIGTLPDSRLRAIRLGEVQRLVCASPAYLATNAALVAPDDLSQHRCISFSGLGQPDRWAFQIHGIEKSVQVQSRLSVNTAEAAIDAAVAGLGLTQVLSYQIAAPRNAGQLHTVLDTHAPPAIPVSMVYDAQGALPLKLRAFLDFGAPRIRESLRSRRWEA
ncbi:LysR substrate-binding domain-containing protein [Cypionkella sinensis]|uniref:LysR substrate-binding domain-containing protein n=1 Tax=Cypionkella sinensis TaxID=1756043 RepID=A0ABV7IYF4_9RHOB